MEAAALVEAAPAVAGVEESNHAQITPEARRVKADIDGTVSSIA